MEQIKLVARFSIYDNKLAEFKKQAKELIKAVRENEPGAIDYDWYLDESKMQCIVIETYADSKAVMAHAANAGEMLQKMDEFTDLTLEVFGNPDEELSKLVSDMGVPVYPFYSGL